MLSSFVAVVVLLTLQTAQADETTGNSKKPIMVNADGCVDGSSLKMARPAGIDDAELIVSPIYRLTGTAQIKQEIKALNGRPVRVRGQLSKPAGPSSTMVGNTRVTIGTGPDDPLAPTVDRAPAPPRIDVMNITAREGTCDASRAPASSERPTPTAGIESKSEKPAVVEPKPEAAASVEPKRDEKTATPAPDTPTALMPSKSGAAPTASGHYMYVWTGDADRKGNDFLAVIDADPSSPSYGRLITTVATDQQTMYVHHTEYAMPASGMLFANDHDAGRTFIFDLRDPIRPKVATSFTDIGGYMHPHSYLRLPNGNVLATFQHAHHGPSTGGKSGGLVELDDHGQVVRSASSADPAFADALLTPYSLVVLPELDRVVSTNSSMHRDDIFAGATYQVWRLSDLKLLETAYFDVGPNHYSHISPEEPRLGPDGSIYVQTLGCGIERITGLSSNEPRSQLVHTFPGNWCGVPTIVGHFLVQSVPATHGLIVLDITYGAKPVEVARLKLSDTFAPHWTGWDAKTKRLVVTGSEPRLYMLKMDEQTGALTLDDSFRDGDGASGFNFNRREWPHGWTGTGNPHGVVFSR
jgi:hypothetical protein